MVQPPVGKLAMAVGEWLFGLTTLGWRVAPALFGTLAVLVMCRVARRLTRSTLLGCTAGLLLSLDGLEFVLSRTGILDIFLMFFVLAAFGALVVDRDVSRGRLAEAMVLAPGDEGGPAARHQEVAHRGGHPHRPGLCVQAIRRLVHPRLRRAVHRLGHRRARRTAGLRAYVRGALVRDGKWLPLTLGVIPLVTYTLTWTGWMVTNTGYDRDYARLHGMNIPVISPLYSLFVYHREMVQFGVGLNARHPYMSQPWDWFVITRPVAFYWNSYTDAGRAARGQGGHHRAVGARGTRDREPGDLVGVPPRDGVLPRLVADPQRLAGRVRAAVRGRRVGELAAVRLQDQVLLLRARVRAVHDHLHRAVPRADHRPGHRPAAAQGRRLHRGGRYVLAVLAVFWYFYPILAGKVIPYSDWLIPHVVQRLDLVSRPSRNLPRAPGRSGL